MKKNSIALMLGLLTLVSGIEAKGGRKPKSPNQQQQAANFAAKKAKELERQHAAEQGRQKEAAAGQARFKEIESAHAAKDAVRAQELAAEGRRQQAEAQRKQQFKATRQQIQDALADLARRKTQQSKDDAAQAQRVKRNKIVGVSAACTAVAALAYVVYQKYTAKNVEQAEVLDGLPTNTTAAPMVMVS